jgi:hypothetical protein
MLLSSPPKGAAVRKFMSSYKAIRYNARMLKVPFLTCALEGVVAADSGVQRQIEISDICSENAKLGAPRFLREIGYGLLRCRHYVLHSLSDMAIFIG